MRNAVPKVTPESRTIHLKAASTKSERALVSKLKAAFKGRDRAMLDLNRHSRALVQLEAGLRKAGMIEDPPPPYTDDKEKE